MNSTSTTRGSKLRHATVASIAIGMAALTLTACGSPTHAQMSTVIPAAAPAATRSVATHLDAEASASRPAPTPGAEAEAGQQAPAPGSEEAVRSSAITAAAGKSTTGPGSQPHPAQVAAPATELGDSATASYSITSSTYTIKDWSSDGPHSASCADGYYVRMGPPVSATNRAPQPAVDLAISGGSIYIGGNGTPKDQYPGSPALYKSFDYKVTSKTTLKTHTYTFTWWCDAVPPWHGQTATNHTAAAVRSGLGDPRYFYLDALKNDGSRLVVNNSGATKANGNPIIGWPDVHGAANQRWILTPRGTMNNVPMYSIGLEEGNVVSVVRYEIGGDGDALELHYTPGSPLNHGQWQMLDASTGIQGPPGSTPMSSVVLVNTTSGKCLAGDAEQGAQLSSAPCDLADPLQYWTLDIQS